MENMNKESVKELTFFGNKKRFVVFFYTDLKFKDLRKNSSIDVPDANIAKSGSLPGLFVFDDFISEEEEKEMI
jgi:hypothetical protein